MRRPARGSINPRGSPSGSLCAVHSGQRLRGRRPAGRASPAGCSQCRKNLAVRIPPQNPGRRAKGCVSLSPSGEASQSLSGHNGRHRRVPAGNVNPGAFGTSNSRIACSVSAPCYFFFTGPKFGCQAASLRLGAAAMTLAFSFFGFLASRLLRCWPFAMSLSFGVRRIHPTAATARAGCRS